MKVPVVLALLIGIFVLACSTVTPAPAEPTPNIDATVEAIIAQERAVDATVEARAKVLVAEQPTATTYPTYTPVPTGTPPPQPANTPTLVPTATPTFVLAPTPTLTPTPTAVPTPVLTPTAVPTPTPMPIPTATPIPVIDDHGDNVISATVTELNPDFDYWTKSSMLQIKGELEAPDDIDYFSFEAYGGEELFIFSPRFLPLATNLGGGSPR